MFQDPMTTERMAVRRRSRPEPARPLEEPGRRGVKERFSRLTRREREVMQLVVAAKKNKEIAAELGVSPRTVEHHRANIMLKLDARSVVELVTMALHHDLCDETQSTCSDE